MPTISGHHSRIEISPRPALNVPNLNGPTHVMFEHSSCHENRSRPCVMQMLFRSLLDWRDLLCKGDRGPMRVERQSCDRDRRMSGLKPRY